MTQAAAKRCVQTGGLMQRPAVNWVADVCLSPQDKFVIHHPVPRLSHSARPSVCSSGASKRDKAAGTGLSFFSPLGVASNSEGTLGPRDISDHQSVRAKASKASQIKEVDESWRLT